MPIVTNDLIAAHIANTAELRKLQEGLASIESYLSSEKFAGNPQSPNELDGYVSAWDILARIRTARAEAWGAALEA